MIRLYPCTKTTFVIEMLAGVPQGTSQRLAIAEETIDASTYEGRSDLNSDPAFRDLMDFRVRGWGRVNPRVWDVVDYDTCGTVIDSAIVASILRAQGVRLPSQVTIDMLEGVTWS